MSDDFNYFLDKHQKSILQAWQDCIAAENTHPDLRRAFTRELFARLQNRGNDTNVPSQKLPGFSASLALQNGDWNIFDRYPLLLQTCKNSLFDLLSAHETDKTIEIVRRIDESFTDLWLQFISQQSKNSRGNFSIPGTGSSGLTRRLHLLHSAFQNSTDGMIITDLSGIIIEANAAFLDLYGYKRDEVIGKKTDILRSSKTTDELYKAIWHAINTVGEWKGEITNRAKSGEEIPIWLSITPVFEAEQKIGYMALEIDIRQQKLLEARILQSERLAVIGQMAARVAHEIRNPISSIGLNAELLGDEFTESEMNNGSEARALLQAIMDEVDRVANLLEEYLQFARFPVTNLKPGSIAALIREVVENFEMAAKADGITISTRFSPDLPDIKFDAHQMRRVIVNLCRNSIEAMPMGGILEISVKRNDNHTLQIEISDTGYGIPEDDLNKIFNPFFTTKESGTGLGLAIVQQIILEHNGTIHAEIKNGAGTTFYIRLPLRNK